MPVSLLVVRCVLWSNDTPYNKKCLISDRSNKKNSLKSPVVAEKADRAAHVTVINDHLDSNTLP